jgi:hypothetical protein
MKRAISLMSMFIAATAAGCGSNGAPPASVSTGGTPIATENARSSASAAAAIEERSKDDPDAASGLEKLGAELETDETGLLTAVTLPKGTVAEGLKLLQRLPNLKQLSLAGTEASDDDLAVVASLEPLEQLDLSWTQIGDAGIAHLKQLQRLELLDVSWTGVGGASLADLAALTRLKTLNAEGTELTDDGGKRLHEVLPDIEIVMRSETEQPDPQKPKRQTTARRGGGPLPDGGNAGPGAPEHLAVGREAPEIEGNDIDGVAFKLSDYRGKVVVLDFWGHW